MQPFFPEIIGHWAGMLPDGNIQVLSFNKWGMAKVTVGTNTLYKGPVAWKEGDTTVDASHEVQQSWICDIQSPVPYFTDSEYEVRMRLQAPSQSLSGEGKVITVDGIVYRSIDESQLM